MLINTALGKKNQAIGRSKGGLSTKIHARTDALGNPTGFYLTDGQARFRCVAGLIVEPDLAYG